jgi:hypothetical protein
VAEDIGQEISPDAGQSSASQSVETMGSMVLATQARGMSRTRKTRRILQAAVLFIVISFGYLMGLGL